MRRSSRCIVKETANRLPECFELCVSALTAKLTACLRATLDRHGLHMMHNVSLRAMFLATNTSLNVRALAVLHRCMLHHLGTCRALVPSMLLSNQAQSWFRSVRSKTNGNHKNLALLYSRPHDLRLYILLVHACTRVVTCTLSVRPSVRTGSRCENRDSYTSLRALVYVDTAPTNTTTGSQSFAPSAQLHVYRICAALMNSQASRFSSRASNSGLLRRTYSAERVCPCNTHTPV